MERDKQIEIGQVVLADKFQVIRLATASSMVSITSKAVGRC